MGIRRKIPICSKCRIYMTPINMAKEFICRVCGNVTKKEIKNERSVEIKNDMG